MDQKTWDEKKDCKIDREAGFKLEPKLSDVIEDIIDDCGDSDRFTHIEYNPIPSLSVTIEIITHLKKIIFPGYFQKEKLDPVNMKYSMGKLTAQVFDLLSEQIEKSIRHDCFRYNISCGDCSERGETLALDFLAKIPELRRKLGGDVKAIYDGDPAAGSHDEIIFSYPGLLATAIHRIANILFKLKVPILPRVMSEYAHSVTGIDIHPGAQIGENFVIDHGTGVVIGETTVIGSNARLYQGVTLGALSLSRDACQELKGAKRHPTIEDNVIIYSGSTILGGDTVIGANSVIGGNVWLTRSVPPNTKVFLETPKLIFKGPTLAEMYYI